MALSAAAGDVRIRVLGIPQVRADVRAGVFPSRGYCLLTLLALAPDHRLPRAQIAAQLWDNSDTAANLGNLRQLLLRMQRALPTLDTLLGVDKTVLWLTAEREQIDLCRLLSLTAEQPET